MAIKWRGIIAQMNTPTGDRRVIESFRWREFPLTLRVQREDDGGHSHAEPCGTIEAIEIVGNDVIGSGLISDTIEAGIYAAKVIREGVMRGVSVDNGEFHARYEYRDRRDGTVYTDADLEALSGAEYSDLEPHLEDWFVMEDYEIAALTIVATPAFAAARIEIDDSDDGDDTAEDGTEDDADTADAEDDADERLIASIPSSPVSPLSMVLNPQRPTTTTTVTVPQRFVASSMFKAPADAFRPHDFDGYERFTIDPKTRTIYGHIYPWDGKHRGALIEPPRSTDFSQFLTGGSITLDNGQTIDVGVVTMFGGHMTDAHTYDLAREDPANQLGPVVLYADEFGVQACGIVWPDVDEVSLARAAAAYPSGDWSVFAGEYKLTGVALVNNPGYHAFDVAGVTERLVASMAPVRPRRKADRSPMSARARLNLADLRRRMNG